MDLPANYHDVGPHYGVFGDNPVGLVQHQAIGTRLKKLGKLTADGHTQCRWWETVGLGANRECLGSAPIPPQ